MAQHGKGWQRAPKSRQNFLPHSIFVRNLGLNGAVPVLDPSGAIASQIEIPAIKASADVSFGVGELLYARTDSRGIIVAANPVFRRVSGYDWPQLIGAPPNLLRHPATPKTVLRILWSAIKERRPAAAYVCNLDADGQHYWVLAILLPSDERCLSVRIKPTSSQFAATLPLYADLCAAEASGLSVEAAEASLLAALRKVGFADYRQFMRHALAEETAARTCALTQSAKENGFAAAATFVANSAETDVDRIRTSLSQVIADQDALVNDFERLRILPTNMRILASRLEPSGGPVGAISDIYLMISEDIFGKLGAFSQGETSLCKRMSERFEQAVFLMTCAQLQTETLAAMRREDWHGSGINSAKEIDVLEKLARRYHANALQSLTEAVDMANKIHEASAELRRAMLSLATITVMGRVESARIGEAGLRINGPITQPHDGNTVIARILNAIDDRAHVINNAMRQINNTFSAFSLPANHASRAVPSGPFAAA